MNGRSGGPAALGGFLYQMMMHLDWVERLAVSADHGALCLTLEPRGGGDAHIHLTDRRIIEQYKTREGAGTWSMREIVHGPLVDFVRAAQTHQSDNDEFRFVTDGRVDHHDSLQNFLLRCAACSKKGTALDQQNVCTYRKIGNLTDHGLFEWIRTEVQGQLPTGNTIDKPTLRHVLSRVTLVGGVDTVKTEARLDALLRSCLPDPMQAGAVRDQLIGQLVTQLAKGGIDIQPKEFLRDNGIDVDRASRLADRRRGLTTMLRTVVSRGFSRYRPDHDVRYPPAWNLEDFPIIAIAGPPGVGKTWQLISLALDLAGRDLPCVFQPLQSDVLQSLDRAAETYWNDVLKTPTTVGVSALKHAIKQAARKARGDADSGPWLVALLDGTVSSADLPALIDKVARDDEIRIAITVSHDVAERLREDHAQSVQVVQIADFTDAELTAYFDTFGIEWSDLPLEFFKVLRRPLLANLFVRSGHIPYSESPDSEYGLFELLWKELGTVTGASDLRALARYAFAHPAANAFALEHALPKADPRTLEALKKAGWIEIDHRAHIQIAHDRLLNWALADAIVTDVVAGQQEDEDLITKLRLALAPNSRFGYLLMDVFWKLASAPHTLNSAVKLLSQIETESYDVRSAEFYQYLLPTLGPRALDLIAQRMAATSQALPNVHLLESAVRVIGRQYAERNPEDRLVRYARQWMGTTRGEWTRVGLALAEEGGLVDLIDDVKVIHFADVRAVHSHVKNYWSYDASFAAMKACLGKKPDWLREQILLTNDPEELNALAFQLLHLEHISASSIWQDCRKALVDGTESARGVLLCIRRFRDHALVDYAINALGSSNSHSAGLAFCVLASIAPDEALAQLDKIERSELEMWRNEWLAELYAARRSEMEQWLVRLHADGNVHPDLFIIISNYASPQLTQAVVAHFTRHVAERVQNNNPWLGTWAKALTAPRVRVETQRLAGSETEKSLVAIAKRQIDPTRGWYDHLLEDARSILLAIGGTGIQELFAFELGVTRGRSAHRALEWAPLVAWPGIESALSSHVATDADTDSTDDRRISNCDAIVGLAAIDAEKELERAVFTSAIPGFPLNALRMREGRPPLRPVPRRTHPECLVASRQAQR